MRRHTSASVSLTARHPTFEPGQAAILVVGHGTREPQGVEEFHKLLQLLGEALPGSIVEGCFLELIQPTIDEGVEKCVRRGATRLVVAPLLLFAAGHAKRDIPRAIARASTRWPDLDIQQASPLESHPAIIELSLKRFEEALHDAPPVPDSRTLWLAVGRGSLDAAANRAMFRFAKRRARRRPVGSVHTCFAAMAEPSIEQALADVVGLEFERIVVQPHLLFHGELWSRIDNLVHETALTHRDRQWIVTAPLGPDPLLRDAILARVNAGDRG